MSDNKITKEQVDQLISESKVEDVKIGEKSTVVALTLPNGFTIIESSSCVDPENYDHDLGKSVCINRIGDKVWAFEGYRLQCELNNRCAAE
jgi:hypothetical protein